MTQKLLLIHIRASLVTNVLASTLVFYRHHGADLFITPGNGSIKHGS